MFFPRRRFGIAYLALAVVALAAVGALFLQTRSASDIAYAAASTTAPPSANEFADALVGTANAFAVSYGDRARIARADCVQASRGHYMCSYAALRPGQQPECHIMQARWTPHAQSSFAVTRSGRVPRCGSLREALRSLT